jgi:thiamine biosynthesis lipoprotein
MNVRQLNVAACLVMLVHASCAKAEPLVISGPTMGTSYHVKVVGASASDEPSLRAEIESALTDIDRRLSTYRQDSEISRFNRAPAGQWIPVSPATAEIVAAAKQFAVDSNGALDVTVGPLVRLWHFGPDALTAAKSTDDLVPPTDVEIDKARAQIGHEKLDVRLDPPALRKQVAGLEIDLSSIGEGHAIDRIVKILSQRSYQDYLVELGGEVRVLGHNPNGRPWRVAVQRPSDDSNRTSAFLELQNAAVATSGDYRRYFEFDGQRYSHIIDPRTSRPIAHNLAAVTVAADTALEADVWDTALLVLGPERGYRFAVERKLAALFISREGELFSARETPVWRERFAIDDRR